jgi:uncharacterized protein (UPF0335 family)
VTIKDLVLRYEVDVLTRIETLEEEKADIARFGSNLFKDLDDQIAHWKATLADILTVIGREGFRSK